MDLAGYVMQVLAPLVQLLSGSSTRLYNQNRDLKLLVAELLHETRELRQRLEATEARFLYLTPPALRNLRNCAESAVL